MDKCNVLRFPTLHTFLKTNGIVGVRGKTPQYEFYCELFSCKYDAAISQSQVSKWVHNGMIINNEILVSTAASPALSQQEYSRSLCKRLTSNSIFFPDGIEKQLVSLISKDRLKGDLLISESGNTFTDLYDILACAFVEALTNDNVEKNISIENYDDILRIDRQCYEQNYPLSAPYILKIFIDKGNSVLIRSLNSLANGFGDVAVEAIDKYCSKSHSNPHPGWHVENSDLLFYAKKYAFLNCKETAGEQELLQALFLTGSKKKS